MWKIILLLIATWIIASIAHENDIARTCKEMGNSHYAGWTVYIQCNEMEGK
jgi:hypothetical protein